MTIYKDCACISLLISIETSYRCVCLCRAKAGIVSFSTMYVRAPFVPPTVEKFMIIFEQPESQIKPFREGSLGDISVYKPYDNYRKGAGLLSFLGNIGKRIIPFVSKLVKPALLDFGSGVIDDMRLREQQFKVVYEKRRMEAVKHIVARAMRGEEEEEEEEKEGCIENKKE